MLLEHSQTFMAVAPVSVADVIDMPYSSALLLDGRFDASLTDTSLFSRAGKSGFESYVESMWNEDEAGNEVFVGRLYKRSAVLNIVRQNAVVDKVFASELAWRVGFVLGWLSALALVQPDDALVGLRFLRELVGYEQWEQSEQQQEKVA